MKKIKLVLTFPGAFVGKTFNNNVKAELTPYNEGENEDKVVIEDDLNFKLTATLITTGVFNKNSNDMYKLHLDPGANETVESNYVVSFINNTLYPIKSLEITDGPFDSRYYIKAVEFRAGAENISKVYGVTETGERIEVPFNLSNDNYIRIRPFDEVTYNGVMEQVRQVRNNELDVSDTERIPTRFTRMEVELKEDYVMDVGKSFVFMIHMGLNDPYNSDELEVNRYENEATANFLLDLPGEDRETTLNSSSYANPVKKQENMRMTKATIQNYTGSLGEKFAYRVQLDLRNLSRLREFENPVIVDVFPKGVTFNGGVYAQNSSYLESWQVVDNYNGTDRQALILNLKDLSLLDEKARFHHFDIGGTINEFAIPLDQVTAENNNINHAYFYADNFKTIPEGIGLSETNKLIDQFDVNGNGNHEDIIVGATSDMFSNLPKEVRSNKYIRKSGQNWVTSSIVTDFNEEFEYRLTTTNYSEDSITSFILYDRFPYVGDSRGSKFANTLEDSISVPDGFTVYYRTDDPGTDVKIAAQDSPAWQTSLSDYSKATAIKIVMNPGREIQTSTFTTTVAVRTSKASIASTAGR